MPVETRLWASPVRFGDTADGASYYSVGRFSKFVQPGAKRMAPTTATADLDDVAFQTWMAPWC